MTHFIYGWDQVGSSDQGVRRWKVDKKCKRRDGGTGQGGGKGGVALKDPSS